MLQINEYDGDSVLAVRCTVLQLIRLRRTTYPKNLRVIRVCMRQKPLILHYYLLIDFPIVVIRESGLTSDDY